MKRPFVTVGVPCFKGRHFKEALECWKRQTFKDFDVFVQDNCSPDDLKGIFDEVCAGDPRFHFERSEKGSYPYFVENWHKTLDKADGDFFVLGSDDDLYEANFLEELVRLAEKYPTVDMFDARHDLFNRNGIVSLHPRAPEHEGQIEWIYALVCHTRYEVAQSVMARTKALREIGGFVNLPVAWGACDWLTWCRLAKNGVVNSRSRLMHWRFDGGNTTMNASSETLRYKAEALRLARPMWEAMADELEGRNEEERFMVNQIRKKIHSGYLDWLGMATYQNMPFGMFAKEMREYYRDGTISFRRLLRELRGAARRALRR